MESLHLDGRLAALEFAGVNWFVTRRGVAMSDEATSAISASGSTGVVRTKRELAAELNRLLLAAERRAGGRGALKRAALARRLGVSVSSLYAYLDGTTLPPATTFDRLLDELGVSGADRGRLTDARDSLDLRRRFHKRPQPDQGT
jgi:transcriptional regulator with XRE-family HTH domain